MNVYLEKKSLRQKLIEVRKLITSEQRHEKSKLIIKMLTELDEYKRSSLILTYVSCGSEVETHSLIKTALNDGKQVAVPRCVDGLPIIEFFYIKDIEDLCSGSYGILEPRRDPELKLNADCGGMCILPGLAFDRSGGRLGYGKGYYDRFLQNYSGFTAGLCLSEMLLDKPLPRGRFDLPVSAVITENGILRT